MDDRARQLLPDGVREGDVLIYMSGRLLVVDHLSPEAFTIDLVALDEAAGIGPSTCRRTEQALPPASPSVPSTPTTA